MNISRWLSKKENVTGFIVPFITAILGGVIGIYEVEIKASLNTLGDTIVELSRYLVWAGLIVLITAYIRRFVWKQNNSEDIQDLRVQLESLTLNSMTTTKAFVTYLNELPNEEISRVADKFVMNGLNIDALEQIGLRRSIVTLLKAKYHELEAIKYNATISFK